MSANAGVHTSNRYGLAAHRVKAQLRRMIGHYQDELTQSTLFCDNFEPDPRDWPMRVVDVVLCLGFRGHWLRSAPQHCSKWLTGWTFARLRLPCVEKCFEAVAVRTCFAFHLPNTRQHFAALAHPRFKALRSLREAAKVNAIPFHFVDPVPFIVF